MNFYSMYLCPMFQTQAACPLDQQHLTWSFTHLVLLEQAIYLVVYRVMWENQKGHISLCFSTEEIECGIVHIDAKYIIIFPSYLGNLSLRILW